MGKLIKLERLLVTGWSKLQDLEGLLECTVLSSMHISGFGGLDSLPLGMEKLIELERLSVMGCSKLINLEGLLKCTALSLRSLRISVCSMLPSVASVPQGLKDITTVNPGIVQN